MTTNSESLEIEPGVQKMYCFDNWIGNDETVLVRMMNIGETHLTNVRLNGNGLFVKNPDHIVNSNECFQGHYYKKDDTQFLIAC